MTNADELIDEVGNVVTSLLKGMVDGNMESYDPVDLQETSLGRMSKKLWNKGSKLGLLYAIPIQIVEVFAPQIRYLFVKVRKQPICYAQVGTSCLLLSQTSQGQRWHRKYADYCLRQLLLMSNKTKSGIGWGINLEWLTKGGKIPANTSCYTQTYYCFEFIDQQNKLSSSPDLLEYLHQISEQVANDYQEFVDRQTGMLVSGYSVVDERLVINAMSYRSLILFLSFELFKDQKYLHKATQSLEFVLKSQGDDGEWFYSDEERFIDGYHTCFILKNLIAIRDVTIRLENDSVTALSGTIAKGLEYFNANLINQQGFPVPFSVTNKPLLYKYDAYDLAESINLYSLLSQNEKVKNLLNFFIKSMRTRRGLTKFRYYSGVSKFLDGVSYNRYANSAMLLALSKYIFLKERKNV